MSDAIHLRIADLTLRVSSSEPDLRIGVSGAAERFLVDETKADVAIETRWGAERPGGGRLVFDSGGVWQLWDRDGAKEFRCSSPHYGELPYKVGAFENDLRRGTVTLHRPYFEGIAMIDPLEYPLDEVLVTNLLAAWGGVEVHGCGIADSRGRGFLFAGQSGAGKTTLARLLERHAPETTVLSDDRIVVREHEGEIRIHGTPWHGEAELAAPMSAPLAGVYFLERGAVSEAMPLDAASAVARLLTCSFPPLYDAAAVGSTLDFLARLTERVPCGVMRVVPDVSVVKLIEGLTPE